MRSAIRMKEFYTLLEFASRAAVFAIRERSRAWVIDGLTAITMIEAERVDWRDILCALGLLHHAATRVGLDGDRHFARLAPLAEPGTAALLDDFRTRPPGDKKLVEWGYEEIKTDEGIGLVQCGYRGGELDQAVIAIADEIAAHLRTDRYRPSSIDVDEDLPEVWLESRNNVTALRDSFAAVRTSVTIDAELRRTRGVPTGSQHFVVYLLEMKTKKAAQQLLEIARKKKPDFFCKVELAEGRLFCLIVARSWWSGVKSYETPESLARFAQPIGDILRRHSRRESATDR
jgi:hypothetical protein